MIRPQPLPLALDDQALEIDSEEMVLAGRHLRMGRTLHLPDGRDVFRRNGVVTVRAERMTARQTPDPEPDTAPCAVALDRLDGDRQSSCLNSRSHEQEVARRRVAEERSRGSRRRAGRRGRRQREGGMGKDGVRLDRILAACDRQHDIGFCGDDRLVIDRLVAFEAVDRVDRTAIPPVRLRRPCGRRKTRRAPAGARARRHATLDRL